MYIITGEQKLKKNSEKEAWLMITKIPFDKEVGGYNRVQVDSYVALLTEAYSEAFNEYERASSKYNKLLDKIYRGEDLEEVVVGKERTVEDYYQEAVKLDAQVSALRL